MFIGIFDFFFVLQFAHSNNVIDVSESPQLLGPDFGYVQISAARTDGNIVWREETLAKNEPQSPTFKRGGVDWPHFAQHPGFSLSQITHNYLVLNILLILEVTIWTSMKLVSPGDSWRDWLRTGVPGVVT